MARSAGCGVLDSYVVTLTTASHSFSKQPRLMFYKQYYNIQRVATQAIEKNDLTTFFQVSSIVINEGERERKMT